MRKEFFFVCSALFLLVFGTYISGTLLVPYAKTLGSTGMSIGIIYSCMYLVRLLLGTPIGRISQKKGTKTMLTFSLILYPFIAIAYLVSWNIPSLIVARLLHGIASAMMLPMAMAYIGEVSPSEQEGRFMGIYNTILFIASAAGPFVGGIIYDTYGIRHAFLILFILALSSLFIILVFTKNNFSKNFNKASTIDTRNTIKENTLSELWRNKKLLALCSINIATAILLALFGASFTQLALSYNFSMGLIGLLIALNNIIIGITQVPFGHFVDRHDKLKTMLVSGIVTCVLIIFLPLVKNIWGVAILIAALGLFTALNLATSTALSAILGKEVGMGNTMGFLGSANSAGTVVGYLVLGGIADLFGLDNAFYFTGAVFLVGIIVFYLLWVNRSIFENCKCK